SLAESYTRLDEVVDSVAMGTENEEDDGPSNSKKPKLDPNDQYVKLSYSSPSFSVERGVNFRRWFCDSDEFDDKSLLVHFRKFRVRRKYLKKYDCDVCKKRGKAIRTNDPKSGFEIFRKDLAHTFHHGK